MYVLLTRRLSQVVFTSVVEMVMFFVVLVSFFVCL